MDIKRQPDIKTKAKRRVLRVTKTAVRDAIIKLNGNLSMVARTFGRSRTWLYKYLKRETNQNLWVTIGEARETMKDNVESKLYSNALAGMERSVFYFLNTQARDRGYGEIMKHEGIPKQVAAVQITITEIRVIQPVMAGREDIKDGTTKTQPEDRYTPLISPGGNNEPKE